jgi:hypothetical protein
VRRADRVAQVGSARHDDDLRRGAGVPDAGTGLLIVTVAAPTNAVVTGHPSSWSTAGIELQVSMHGGGQHWGATLSGSPQGGVTSPILSNIYLHKLDSFVEQVLIPEYTRGERRRHNPDYHKWAKVIERARRRGDRAAVREGVRLFHRYDIPVVG